MPPRVAAVHVDRPRRHTCDASHALFRCRSLPCLVVENILWYVLADVCTIRCPWPKHRLRLSLTPSHDAGAVTLSEQIDPIVRDNESRDGECSRDLIGMEAVVPPAITGDKKLRITHVLWVRVANGVVGVFHVTRVRLLLGPRSHRSTHCLCDLLGRRGVGGARASACGAIGELLSRG